MIDGIIKADGTSRLMRATLPATYEEFRAQCAAGTQPLDVLFNAIGWSQLPTFLNKANLTQDDVAALFGKDSGAVPNDLFAWLGQYAQHWWSVLHGQAGTGYEEKRTAISVDVRIVSNGSRTISYAKNVTVDQETGVVSLANPQTLEMSSLSSSSATNSCSALAELLPVYITGLEANSEKIYYLPANSTWGNVGHTFHGKTFGYWYDGDYDYYLDLAGEDANVFAQEVSSQLYNIPAGATTFVYSTDRNAYPDSGTVDGLTYQYLGIPFQNAVTAPKIATGSYTGTGTYGESNPTSLTFDFEPKLVLVAGRGEDAIMPDTAILIGGKPSFSVPIGNSNGMFGTITWSGATVSWYGSSAAKQLNYSGYTFYYCAIG